METILKNILLSLALLLSLGLSTSCSTEEVKEPKESFFDRLESDQIVKLQIAADFSELIDHRAEKMKQAALLSFENQAGLAKTYPVQVSLRGKTRREVCAFPPLKLNFKASLLKAEGLNKDFDKYKLVTHCMEDSDLVLKEFLAYQLYNQLTEYSFRVRLVELTYVDTGGEMETMEQYGILLESYKEITERFGAHKMPDQFPENTRVSNEDYQRLALFQYMIGNTDWNLTRQHNIKWLRTKNAAIPVPYDFDYSGLVNAPYAKPHPSLPIDSVRERFLQYRGNDLQKLENMSEQLTLKQVELLQICQQFPLLDDMEKQDVLVYLNDFFSIDIHTLTVK